MARPPIFIIAKPVFCQATPRLSYNYFLSYSGLSEVWPTECYYKDAKIQISHNHSLNDAVNRTVRFYTISTTYAAPEFEPPEELRDSSNSRRWWLRDSTEGMNYREDWSGAVVPAEPVDIHYGRLIFIIPFVIGNVGGAPVLLAKHTSCRRRSRVTVLPSLALIFT